MIRAKSIMKTNVITVDPKLTVSDAARIMTNNRVGSLVIMKGRRPLGMVTDGDIVGVVAAGKHPKHVRIGELPARRRFVTADPEDSIKEVTKKMIKNGVKRLPVVKDGKLLGIISDKELLLISPELLEILSEKLKMRVEAVPRPDKTISGICESCGDYSDDLTNVDGSWVCEDCSQD